MSITVSMFLEAVASSIDNAYEVNSSEDLIANIEEVNKIWRERMSREEQNCGDEQREAAMNAGDGENSPEMTEKALFNAKSGAGEPENKKESVLRDCGDEKLKSCGIDDCGDAGDGENSPEMILITSYVEQKDCGDCGDEQLKSYGVDDCGDAGDEMIPVTSYAEQKDCGDKQRQHQVQGMGRTVLR